MFQGTSKLTQFFWHFLVPSNGMWFRPASRSELSNAMSWTFVSSWLLSILEKWKLQGDKKEIDTCSITAYLPPQQWLWYIGITRHRIHFQLGTYIHGRCHLFTLNSTRTYFTYTLELLYSPCRALQKIWFWIYVTKN